MESADIRNCAVRVAHGSWSGMRGSDCIGAGLEYGITTQSSILSIGTWISTGNTHWAHDASSIAGLGNPTSKLDL